MKIGTAAYGSKTYAFVLVSGDTYNAAFWWRDSRVLDGLHNGMSTPF